MRSRSLVALAVAVAGTMLTACDGLKEALTAHVDVVARAGSQELSVTRLGDLLGNAKIQVPVTRDNAAIVADIWTGYQQIAYAAAHGDSLNDKKQIDKALAPIFNMGRLQRFMDSISKTFKVDSATESTYNQASGGLLAARHILIGYKNPSVPPSSVEKDSLRKKGRSGSRAGHTGKLRGDGEEVQHRPDGRAEQRKPRRVREGHDDRRVLERDGHAQAG
jgi:hypothetical protein